MKKLALVAVIVLALAALSCETPVDEPVVNVRIYNNGSSELDLNVRLGTVVFDFATTELPLHGYSEYKAITAGTYQLEGYQISDWIIIDADQYLPMLESGNYTVTLNADNSTSVAKD